MPLRHSGSGASRARTCLNCSTPWAWAGRVSTMPSGPSVTFSCKVSICISRPSALISSPSSLMSANSRQAVARLVDGILDVARGAGATGWRGCLIGNTALELGASDPEVVTRLKVGVEIFRTLFKKAISLPSATGANARNTRSIWPRYSSWRTFRACSCWPNPDYRMPTSKTCAPPCSHLFSSTKRRDDPQPRENQGENYL